MMFIETLIETPKHLLAIHFRMQLGGALGADGLLAVIAYELGRPQQTERLAAQPTETRSAFGCMQFDFLHALDEPTDALPFRRLQLLVALHHRNDGVALFRVQRSDGRFHRTPAGLQSGRMEAESVVWHHW